MKCAIFDLDGTLVNTIIDLANSVDYVLSNYGYEKKWSIEQYTSFVGNGARVLLDRAFEHTLSERELDKAFEIFKLQYNKTLTDNAFIYDSITDALDYLKAKGIKLAVVTNKPNASAVKMVDELFGKGYFDYVIGATDQSPKKPDPFTTNKALEVLGCSCDEAIFFGDSDIDVYTAKNANVKSVACSWGFRSYDCLLSASPSLIIDSPKYIKKLF